MEKAPCYNCENINEVKISSGHNKPENKGKKYFTCANCDQFQWVESGKGIAPNGFKVDYSKTPNKPAPIAQNQPKEEKVDWDAKDRQSMAQTAMKSASEIVAAIIMSKSGMHAEDMATNPLTNVKEMANEFYKELKIMKNDDSQPAEESV